MKRCVIYILSIIKLKKVFLSFSGIYIYIYIDLKKKRKEKEKLLRLQTYELILHFSDKIKNFQASKHDKKAFIK